MCSYDRKLRDDACAAGHRNSFSGLACVSVEQHGKSWGWPIKVKAGSKTLNAAVVICQTWGEGVKSEIHLAMLLRSTVPFGCHLCSFAAVCSSQVQALLPDG